jgi:hypothetical protein
MRARGWRVGYSHSLAAAQVTLILVTLSSVLKVCIFTSDATIINNINNNNLLQINSAWLHVSAAHAAIFRPALDRTSTFDVRTIWDPIAFTCMIQVRDKSLLKRLQVVAIGWGRSYVRY